MTSNIAYLQTMDILNGRRRHIPQNICKYYQWNHLFVKQLSQLLYQTPRLLNRGYNFTISTIVPAIDMVWINQYQTILDQISFFSS